MTTTQILNFKKREHFMLRQWERGIDDRTIRLALRYVMPQASQLIVIDKMFFVRNGIQWGGKSLIINAVGNRLVTIFRREGKILKKYLVKQKFKQPVQFIF
jgi:hypothetical protein